MQFNNGFQESTIFRKDVKLIIFRCMEITVVANFTFANKVIQVYCNGKLIVV